MRRAAWRTARQLHSWIPTRVLEGIGISSSLDNRCICPYITRIYAHVKWSPTMEIPEMNDRHVEEFPAVPILCAEARCSDAQRAMVSDHRVRTGLPDRPAHWLQSYPAHLSRTWTLPSGQSLCVRPIRHDDGELEEAFVRALSLESRYQRMLSGGTKVTPEWIDSMTHIDYQRHMAIAVSTALDGVEQFVGVGRY